MNDVNVFKGVDQRGTSDFRTCTEVSLRLDSYGLDRFFDGNRRPLFFRLRVPSLIVDSEVVPFDLESWGCHTSLSTSVSE